MSDAVAVADGRALTPEGATLAQATVRAGAWSLAATVGARLLSLASLVVLARLLSPVEFGLVAVGLVYVTYVETVGDLGSAAALVWWPGDRENAANAAFILSSLSGVAWCAVTVAAAPLVAGFFRTPAATPLLRALALTFLLKGLANAHDALCQRDLRFRARAVPELGGVAAKAAIAIGLAAAGFGAWSLAWGQVAGQAVATVLVWRVVPWRPRWRWAPGTVRPLLAYGRGIMAVNVVGAVVHHADLVVVGRWLGAASLGLYQVAAKLPEAAITIMVWVTSRVLFPALSRLNGDHQALGRGWLAAVRCTSLLTLPAAAGLAVCAAPLVRAFFGPGWSAAAQVVAPLALAAGLRSAGTHAGDVLKASGRTGTLAALGLAKAVLLVPALLLAVRGGATAVAWALTGVTAANALLSVTVAARLTSVSWRRYAAAIVPALGTAAASAAAAAAALRMAPAPEALPFVVALGAGAGVVAAGILAPDVLRMAWSALSASPVAPAWRAGRVVVPPAAPEVLDFAAREIAVPHTVVQRLGRMLLPGVSRTLLFGPAEENAGLAPWRPVARRALEEDEELSAALETGRWIACERVTGQPAEGALVALFGASTAHPVAAIKLRPLSDQAWLRREQATLRALQGCLPKALGDVLPRPLSYLEHQGWEALLLPWMPGRSPYLDMQAALWPGRVPPLQRAAEWLAGLHVATRSAHRLDPAALDRMLGEVGHGGVSAPWGDALVRAGLPLSLGHGDYWLRNLLLGAAGAVTAVLDWEHARPERPPGEDLFHLVLTSALSLRSPGRTKATAEEAFERAFLRPGPFARAVSAALLAYCAVSGIDPRWLRPLFRLHLAASAPAGMMEREGGGGLAERLERAPWSVFGG